VVGNFFVIAHKISRLLKSSKVTFGKADQKKGGSRTDFTESEAGYES